MLRLTGAAIPVFQGLSSLRRPRQVSLVVGRRGGNDMAYDMITVGGGLAGSALAKNLAERGYRVLVLERETRFKDRVRGEQMHPWGVSACARPRNLRSSPCDLREPDAVVDDVGWRSPRLQPRSRSDNAASCRLVQRLSSSYAGGAPAACRKGRSGGPPQCHGRCGCAGRSSQGAVSRARQGRIP